jgi:hypothetical protein
MQRARRLWLIDRQAAAIGNDLRDDLGNWIVSRLRRGVTLQGDKAKDALDDCGVPLNELRKQWELQQTAQLSLRTRKSVYPQSYVLNLRTI